MTTERCDEMQLLIQADADGGLGAGEAAAVSAHLAGCAACAATQQGIIDLSARLRTALPYHAAPVHLRESIAARFAVQTAAQPVVEPPAPARAFPRFAADRRRAFRRVGRRAAYAAFFGAGVAAAASVMLLVLPPREGDMAGSVVASHIRALQPGHLMDVASTDQHTVKPWFDGRLDYAPPVRDLAAGGFPLIGGRLDYLAGRPVAALAYRRGQHVIDLYVWPARVRVDAPGKGGDLSGYNFVRWTQDDMAFWAVSDLAPADLDAFVAQWQAAG